MIDNLMGIQLFKGDIVKYEKQLYEVAEDNKIVDEPAFGPPHWGSVWLKNFYPPVFTHKGEIEVVHRKNLS